MQKNRHVIAKTSIICYNYISKGGVNVFVVATFNEIISPTIAQRLKYFIKEEDIKVSNKPHYELLEIRYIGKKQLKRIVPKLFTFSDTIIVDKSISKEELYKYSFYTPKDFINQVAVNTVCYAVLRSRVPINKRNITLIDKQGKYINLARILVEHFFYVNIVTENIEAYEEFKNAMMNELGAVVLLNSGDKDLENICVSTKEEDMGSFRIKEQIFFCEDTIIRGLDIPHNVNRLYFACAMQEIEHSTEYSNIVAEILLDPKTERCIPIQNVVRLIDKNIN